MFRRSVLAAAMLALAATAQAVPLAAGSWAEFTVDEVQSASFGLEWIAGNGDGSPLVFDITVAAGRVGRLTVVDAGFSGDRFTVRDGAAVLGVTSPGVDGDSLSDLAVVDFDAALADARFSRGVFMLGAGTHHIAGVLSTSLANAYGPLNATLGGVRLEVMPVPEPASVALLVAGLGLLAGVTRRRPQ